MNGELYFYALKEIDMAVGPIGITSERMSVVDFTVLYVEDGGGILTKKENSMPDIMNVFRPFHPTVWLLIAIGVVVTTISLSIMMKVARFCSCNICSQRYEPPWTFMECMLMVFGSFTSQGTSSGRVVLGCWWVFAILIQSMYTASLASLLTVRIQENIDTLEELAASSLDPVSFISSYWYDLFVNSDKGVSLKIGSRMAAAPKINARSEAMELVRAGTAAYIVDMQVARFLYGQDCNNLHLAPTGLTSNGLGFALPKNAYYKEAMSTVILKLQESGILEQWQKLWWKAAPECSNPQSTFSKALPLEIYSVGGLLIVYFSVGVLALLAHLLQRLPCWAGVRQWLKNRR